VISEISSLFCNDLERLRMPTVLCYVLCFTSVSGFESHSLRQFLNRSQTCGFRELVTIFKRFLLLKIVKSLDSQY
jgi:hypothetical protein